MPTVFMLIGLPGSGKSTYAKKLKNKIENNNHKAVIISADEIRKEVFGDEAIQKNEQYDSSHVFVIADNRIKLAMLEGKNIIFDATNINRKKRKAFLTNINKSHFLALKNTNYVYSYQAVLIATPYEKCLKNNLNRRRVVPEEVIKRMMCNFEVPMKFEGWDRIEVVRPFGFCNDWAPKGYNCYLSYLYDRNDIPHDCEPWHTGTITEHIYEVVSEVYKDKILPKGEKEFYMTIAMWHDVGKFYVKAYNEKKKRCTYYNHNNVSAYLYCTHEADLDIAFVIEKHMEAHKYDSDQECYNILSKQGIDDDLIFAIIRFGDYDNAGALAVPGTKLK